MGNHSAIVNTMNTKIAIGDAYRETLAEISAGFIAGEYPHDQDGANAAFVAFSSKVKSMFNFDKLTGEEWWWMNQLLFAFRDFIATMFGYDPADVWAEAVEAMGER